MYSRFFNQKRREKMAIGEGGLALIAAAGQAASNIPAYGGRSWKRYKKAAALQYEYDQKAAEAANARQIAMYNTMYANELKTSDPRFQAQRLSAAGFNPRMMFQSDQSGLGISMPSASNDQSGVIGTPLNDNYLNFGAEQVMNFALLNAQKSLLKAQADNLNAQTDDMKGIDREIKEMSLIESIERIRNSEIQREGHRLDNALKDINLDIQNSTKESQIQKITYDTKHSIKQLEFLSESIIKQQQENHITKATADALINKAFADLKNTIIEGTLKNAEIKLTQAQTKNVSKDTELKNEQRLNEDAKRHILHLEREIIRERLDLEWEQLRIDETLRIRGQDRTMWGSIMKITEMMESWEIQSLDKYLEGALTK